ncbi:MAG: hypothetical protein ACLQIB_38460 [Isosphaeraceae bacterium]
MSDELGSAELSLGADLAPLDADLRDAKTRVALAVAEMQKMLDSLHADIDFKAQALEAAAARMAAAGVPVGAGSSSSALPSSSVTYLTSPYSNVSIGMPN